MELFKFTLGPYELFASIIGGIPLLLEIFLIYNPGVSPQDLFSIIQSSSSIQFLATLALLAYLVGGLIQGITWEFFLTLCNLSNQDFHFFKSSILAERDSMLSEREGEEVKPSRNVIDFEEKVSILVCGEIGAPKNLNWIYSRLHLYLKEHGRPSVLTADLYQATHMMYRNISFGLVVMGIVSLVHLLRLSLFSVEQIILLLLYFVFAYVAFLRSLAFKRWYTRELLLGFYFFKLRTLRIDKTESPIQLN